MRRLGRAAELRAQPGGESYSSYADIIGTLECAKLELYRRWVAAYEDKAIARHGDI